MEFKTEEELFKHLLESGLTRKVEILRTLDVKN